MSQQPTKLSGQGLEKLEGRKIWKSVEWRGDEETWEILSSNILCEKLSQKIDYSSWLRRNPGAVWRRDHMVHRAWVSLGDRGKFSFATFPPFFFFSSFLATPVSFGSVFIFVRGNPHFWYNYKDTKQISSEITVLFCRDFFLTGSCNVSMSWVRDRCLVQHPCTAGETEAQGDVRWSTRGQL